MRGKDIIIVADQPWDIDIGSNIKNIAREFAKHNRVLYVNPPLDRISKIRKKRDPKIQKRLNVIKGYENDLVNNVDNLWILYPKMVAESINWVKPAGLYNRLNYLNNKRLAEEIKRSADCLGFQNFVIFNDSLMFKGLYLKELLNPSVHIYYTRDYLIIQPYFKRHGIRCEAEIMDKSDLVVANSTYLRDYAKQHNRNAYYVGQGCETEMFSEELVKEVPEEMKEIPRPRITYVGYLTNMRLDIELLLSIAKSRPQWSLVLVGPEDEAFNNSQLHDLQNVYFLGPKAPDSLPAYVKGADVCINPQQINPLTIGNYPRKIDEYLAMGKPTVATATKAMEVFEDYTYLAEDHTTFVRMLDKAMAEDNESVARGRKAFAGSHTWENSVKAIYEAINKTYQNEPVEQEKILSGH
ncbi:MAG: glycosyltransferase [Bacteroidota bacterium]